jgi:osmotically-inducible protein OsmY
MKPMKLILAGCALSVAIVLSGCSSTSANAPDVSKSVRTALDRAGFTDVSENQDRGKGVVTLAGHVPSEADKAQAESIARSMAPGQVIADQIEVLPPGASEDAKKIDSSLDKGIENNLDAALIQDGSKGDVKYSVNNGVIVLTGSVDSQSRRAEVERLAAGVPYARQVVNELQVKNQKATSTR